MARLRPIADVGASGFEPATLVPKDRRGNRKYFSFVNLRLSRSVEISTTPATIPADEQRNSAPPHRQLNPPAVFSITRCILAARGPGPQKQD